MYPLQFPLSRSVYKTVEIASCEWRTLIYVAGETLTTQKTSVSHGWSRFLNTEREETRDNGHSTCCSSDLVIIFMNKYPPFRATNSFPITIWTVFFINTVFLTCRSLSCFVLKSTFFSVFCHTKITGGVANMLILI